MAAFSLQLLGDPVLVGPEGPVTGRAAYRRRLALLSILAVARGRPVGRERIIGLLWPDNPTEAARHTLSEALYVLRKELGDDAFVTVGDELALNPAVIASDVDEFETAVEAMRAEDAMRLYRGPLLDGFYVAEAPDFDRWAEGERGRLARIYGQALEGLAVGAEASGDAAGAVQWWRRLAAHDRYSSRVALRLVRALDASGDRMAALRYAGAHAVLLREELGGEPDRELMELVERLRTEPVSVPAPAAPPSAAPAPAAPVETAEGAEAGGGAAAPPDAAPTTDGTREEGAAAVASSAPAPSPVPAPDRVTAEAAPAVPPPHDARASARRHRNRGALIGGTAVAALVAALALTRPGGGAPEAAPRYDPRRVAVLYLDDYSPDGELGYLANGLTEMLIHELAQVEALDVVSRNGVKPYRDRTPPLDSLIAVLRAGTLVEGSVQRSGDSVRVTVQLIDANRQSHLGSQSIVRPLDPEHLFALQDAVAGEVSAALRRRVGAEIRLSSLRREAGDPRALELVLRADEVREDAREAARNPHPRDVEAAARLLDVGDSLLAEASRLDGRWTEPVLRRGWLALERGRLRPGPGQLEILRGGQVRADSVLRRQPSSVDARELRGSALWMMVIAGPEAPEGRAWLTAAERDLRSVVAADPGRASAWATLGQLLRVGGDLAESQVAARHSHEADAYLDVPDVGIERLYRAALALGDFPRARHWCAEGRRAFPRDYRFWECEMVLLARDTSAVPSPDSAWRLLADADRVNPPAAAVKAGHAYLPTFRRMLVAHVLARARLADSARAVAARERARVAGDPELRTDFLWDDAYLQLLLGDRGRAAALLGLYLERRPALRAYVEREPAFRGLTTRRP